MILFGVAVDSAGYVYVADYYNNRIQKFSSTGTFLAKWGAYGNGDGQLKNPIGVAIDSAGYVYVSDYYNNRIQKFYPATDTVPPTTTILTSPGANAAGWNDTDVTVSLTASDNPDGSGVARTEYSFDGNTWNTYSASFTVTAEGTATIYYRSTDQAGNVEAAKTQTINIDKTSPATTAAVSPAANANGWNNTNVSVALSATDNLSGVAKTETNLDSAGWVAYTAPIPISAGGIHTLLYRSTDKAGNVEAAKTQTINIDRTAPEVSITTDPGTLWPPNHKMVAVTIGGSATDSLSDIASISFKVTDEYGTIEPTITGFNTTIQLEAWRDGKDKDGRVYTISVTIKDNAGNETTSSVTIICPHDQGK
jgi:hypothetical protein